MTTDRRSAGRWWLLALLLLPGCAADRGDEAAARDTLTRRQRDSVIGASRLPGAPGVRRAIEIADTAAARAGRLDSIGR